eukprot:TRINITY_DN5716_c0_g1_i1.p1 TRINITY_DN5716_c0_g1~~TRINITY_DN5716_c0_g1_i1.p1  ORF type:complete len:591 (-),score=102.47 TRINITY_DN5716_c0_g1_i1:1106-2878(-)
MNVESAPTRMKLDAITRMLLVRVMLVSHFGKFVSVTRLRWVKRFSEWAAMSSDEEIDILAQAILREFMARKGCKATLAAFDAERPRNEKTISSRTAIVKALSIEKLVRKNKERASPFATMLEMICENFAGGGLNAPAKTESIPAKPDSSTPLPPVPKQLAPVTVPVAERQLAAPEPRPATAPPPVSPRRPLPVPPSVSSQKSTAAPPAAVAVKHEDMIVEDVEEDFGRPTSYPPRPQSALLAMPAAPTKPVGVALNHDDARQLRALVFGKRAIVEEWKQGFVFSDLTNMRFGLVQYKGGPCGVLAAVQAFIIKQLIQMDPATRDVSTRLLNINNDDRLLALESALVEILWMTRNPSVTVVTDGMGRPDSYGAPLGNLNVFVCTSQKQLQQYIHEQLSTFTQERGNGILNFVYSVILSHGIAAVQQEMDDSSNSLIGTHGYSSLELFNLLTTGRAYSNVFDGDKVLKDDVSDTGDQMMLRGVQTQGQIGLLTLFEHYQSLEVGQRLKVPKFPIWVILSESHFTVMFAAQTDLLLQHAQARTIGKFDVYYYDELGNFDDIVKLTLGMRENCTHFLHQLICFCFYVRSCWWCG